MQIKHEQWQQRIQEWKESGLSQTAWCKQQNLKPTQLSYWHRKFEPKTAEPAKNQHSNAFIPIAVAEKPAVSPLTLGLPNGASITGIDESNLGLARQLMEQLL